MESKLLKAKVVSQMQTENAEDILRQFVEVLLRDYDFTKMQSYNNCTWQVRKEFINNFFNKNT